MVKMYIAITLEGFANMTIHPRLMIQFLEVHIPNNLSFQPIY
jgi:hypothetical protein